MEQGKLYEIATEDLPRYFKNTFMRVAPKATPEKLKWVAIDEITRVTDSMQDIIVITSDMPHTQRQAKDLVMDLNFPSVGNYNLNNCSFRLIRYPKRQFKKAMCPDSVAIFNPALYGMGHRYPQSLTRFPWKAGDIEKMMRFGAPPGLGAIRNYYTSIAQKKTLISRAVDNEISISMGLRGREPEIVFGSAIVGKMLSPTCIQLDSNVFEEEFKDRCIPHQIEVIVAKSAHA